MYKKIIEFATKSLNLQQNHLICNKIIKFATKLMNLQQIIELTRKSLNKQQIFELASKSSNLQAGCSCRYKRKIMCERWESEA